MPFAVPLSSNRTDNLFTPYVIMTRTDNEISLIEAAEVFLADATHQASKLEYLKGRNGELEGQLHEMAADMEKLRSEAVVRNTQLCALIEETTASNKFHTDFMSAAGREFSSEAKVVEMKYQVTVTVYPMII